MILNEYFMSDKGYLSPIPPLIDPRGLNVGMALSVGARNQRCVQHSFVSVFTYVVVTGYPFLFTTLDLTLRHLASLGRFATQAYKPTRV